MTKTSVEAWVEQILSWSRYITKPIDVRDLLGVFEQTIDRLAPRQERHRGDMGPK